MSSEENFSPAATPGEHAGPGAGELLKAAREHSGMHIAALAVMLKVPVKKLEALEASRFDLLPDMVFARALASSVCRTLKIDALPILQHFPQTAGTQLPAASNVINAPFRSPNDSDRRFAWSGLPKPAVAAVLTLLIASLVIAYLPQLTVQFNKASTFLNARSATQASTAASDLPSASVDLKSEKSMVGGTAPPAEAAALPGVAGGNPVDSSAAAPQNPTQGSSASAPVTGTIVFRAVGDSWVEVIDGKKQTVLRRTLVTGESVGVSGELPLVATIGRANMTQVDVRGQAFDLAPWSKDNVARFQVK